MTWLSLARNASLFAIGLALAAPSSQGQTFTVLHYFTGGADGEEPTSAPTVDASGNLFGVTPAGGSFDYGTVFHLNPSAQETILHNFLGAEGLGPSGNMIRDAAGNLYGITSNGGMAEGGGCAHGCGTVFKRDTAGQQAVLYAFTGKADGGAPTAGLIRDAAGNLYGTTTNGGISNCYVAYGCGVIFEVDPTGHENVLYRFADGLDGKNPRGMIADTAGNFYGTTYDGGTYGIGNVYKIDSAGNFTLLYSFPGGAGSSAPNGDLVMDRAGNLYGTASSAFDSSGFGIVYKLNSSGNATVLYDFTVASDGEYPQSLIMDSAGNLYGVTEGGGTSSGCYYSSCGTVFKIDTGGNKTILHSFDLADGQLPVSLTMDNAGNLYGTTLGGGKGAGCTYYKGCGVLFKITP